MIRHGLRVLGLSLMTVLSLMALFAVAAQAENLKDGGTPGLYLILGSSALVTGASFLTRLEKLTVKKEPELHGVLLVPGLNISILCSAAHGDGRFLSDTQALVFLEFLECLTFVLSTGEHLASCIIDDPENALNDDRIVLAFAVGLPKLHEKELFILFDGDGSSVLSTIHYLKETGCPLPLSPEIKGSPVGLLSEETAVVHLITFNQEIQKLFQVKNGAVIEGDRILYGAQEAFIDANATIELTEMHIGCKFTVI